MRSAGHFASAGVIALAIACATPWIVSTQGGAVAIDPDDIGGTVTSPKGPEAGVWVIAESNELPTRFIRSVVTDDQGRYLVPDLPRGTYQVFVRGYGLVDSPRVQAKPGQQLNLKAVIAPDGRAAAQVYPANYWLSLMEAPREVANTVKTSCLTCHQLGSRATRQIPEHFKKFGTALEQWDKRVRVGPSGGGMSSNFMKLGAERKVFADWTEKIAAGAFPKEAPPRPRGRERSLVVTQWDYSTPTSFSHTHAASDRRTSMVNPNGKIYAPDRSHDSLVWVDPVEHSAGEFKIPNRDTGLQRAFNILEPSAYWGEEQIWEGTSNARSAVMDHQGRVWIATRIRGAQQPKFCMAGSGNKFAEYFPKNQPSSRQVAFFDPKSEKWTMIDTCWTSDHNEFGEEPDNPLFFGAQNAIGWISATAIDKGLGEEAAQGWCPGVLDTNGDGRITRGWTEPNEPVDPTKDHRINFGTYSVSASPTDHSIWMSGIGGSTTQIVRIERGSNPPETCKGEVYMPPNKSEYRGEGGLEVDSQGVVWTTWRGTDQITAFDRRKCKGPLNGPKATGDHCPEGWTVYRSKEPVMQNSPYAANLNYLIAVDRHDVAGLGRDTAISYALNSDELLAIAPSPNGREFVSLRVPYPLGFYTRNAHGRIDDPKSGWKGRGLWSATMTYAMWHLEGAPGTTGGKGQRPKVVKFQVRPNPLAK
jgi:hypothetical protein